MPSFKRGSEDWGLVCLDKRQEDGKGGGVVSVRYTPVLGHSKYTPHMGAKQIAKAKKRRLAEWERGEDVAVSAAPSAD